MLYPRRANTPVMESNTPGRLSTKIEMVCGVYLAFSSILSMSTLSLPCPSPEKEELSTGTSHTPISSFSSDVYTSPTCKSPSSSCSIPATARTIRDAKMLSYLALFSLMFNPLTASFAFRIASMSFTRRDRASLYTGSLFSASLPVRAT